MSESTRMALKQRNLLSTAAIFCIAVFFWVGCQSNPQPASTEKQVSLYEQRLIRLIGQERQLDHDASQPEAVEAEIQRQFQQLAQSYANLVADNPQSVEARLIYGKLLTRYGDLRGAKAVFIEALQSNPEIAVIHQQLSTIYAEEGDSARALAYGLQAIDLAPSEPIYHFALGELIIAYRSEYLESGSFTTKMLDELIIMAFANAARLAPQNSVFQFRYGEAFYDLEEPNWDDAIKHWLSLLERKDFSTLQLDAIRLHLARCLIETDQPENAREYAMLVTTPGLLPTRDELLEYINSPE